MNKEVKYLVLVTLLASIADVQCAGFSKSLLKGAFGWGDLVQQLLTGFSVQLCTEFCQEYNSYWYEYRCCATVASVGHDMLIKGKVPEFCCSQFSEQATILFCILGAIGALGMVGLYFLCYCCCFRRNRLSKTPYTISFNRKPCLNKGQEILPPFGNKCPICDTCAD